MRSRSLPVRLVIVAMFAAALPGLAFGQQRRGPDLDETMTELTQQLKLTDGQAGQIRELLAVQNEQSRKMIAEARASGQGRSAFGAMRERMREMREDTHKKIKALLTAEQAATYEKMLAEQAEIRRGPSGASGPGGPPGS